ncbi:MAG: CHAT domain-containing protein, partial [Burkholderiales bacterium]
VTDLSGKAALQGAAGKGNIAILSEIAAETRIQLEGGARLVVIYLKSGDEYTFTGPTQIQFRSNEPQVLSGAGPQKRSSPLGKGAWDVTIKQAGVAKGGYIMRSGRPTGRIRLLTLAGTKTLEFSPGFRWQQSNSITRYGFKLNDDTGKPLHEAEVEGTTHKLPASIQLKEGVAYTWELSAQFPDGRRYVSIGDFSLAPKELHTRVEALRPAANAPVAERVLFSAWLDQAELRDEARKYWRELSAERPEDTGLQLLAGEINHPPRTVADITALLDQYQPDPAQTSELQAKVKQAVPPGAAGDTLIKFYLDRAQAAQSLGLVGQQIADLRRAAEMVKGRENEWTITQDIFIAEWQSGNFANALRIKQQMSRMVGSLRGRLIADYASTARMYASIGDLAAARSAYRNLQAMMFEANRWRWRSWEQFGDSWTASFETARASLLDAEGKYIEAETAHRNALAASERAVAASPKAYDVNDPNARPLERALNFVDGNEQRLANNLMMQGRFAEAELAVRNVLQRRLSRLGRYAPGTAITVGQFARLLNEQARFRDAEAMARAALDIHKTIGSAPEASSYVGARRQLGTALVAQSRWKDALPVFEEMSAEIARDPVLARMGRGDPNWGIALVKTGQPEKAVPMLEGGLKRSSERLGPSHYQVAERRGFLAMALVETGQRQRALSEFQEAVKVLLARGGIDSDEESGASARAWRLTLILEGYIKLLYEIRNELRQPGFEPASEAFRVADAARGQTTQRALSASGARAAVNDPALADVIRKEQDAKQQITVLYSTLLRLLNAPPDQQLPQVAAQIRSRIQELEKERRALFSDLEKRFPAYVNLINPKPATVEEARAALREGEALLSVLTTEDRTYVWAIPKSGPAGFHAAGLGDKSVARIVAELRKALDSGEVTLERFPEFDVEATYRLYAELLKPVEAVWKGARTLVVVANGALAQVPFSLLVTDPLPLAAEQGLRFERYKAVPWLIKQVAVVQLPAVNTLATLRALPPADTARSPFAGFGDPQFGREAPVSAPPPTQVVLRMRSAALPRSEAGKQVDWVAYSRLSPLPDTRDEILSIASALKADPDRDVFLGTQANKDNVKKADLRTRRIVAFATHGLIPGDFPNLEEPALALSATDGNSETGLLTLGDILGLKLDADWVVLSACNTAAGEGAGAEAISGLGRGFFYAGSRALLVTHWPVETRSARQLVTTLFERYAGNLALSRAEALKQASLAVMEVSAKDASGKPMFSYAHPVFWAPYALVGDGGR